MGYAPKCLPWPRGETMNESGWLTLTSTTLDEVLGLIFETTDDNGRELKLRVVRADAALTDVGRKAVSYTAGKVGRNVDALCDTDGEICSIVDDAYATTKDIAQYDAFYVVEEGDVLAIAESAVNAAGVKVMGKASADDVTVATAGSYIIGFANDAVSSGSASIHVCGGLKPSDPAT